MYNGNPISDLSLGAFLDKFMEKKPKQNTWHGASEIEPAKKVSKSAFQFTLRCSQLLLRIFRRQLAKEDLFKPATLVSGSSPQSIPCQLLLD